MGWLLDADQMGFIENGLGCFKAVGFGHRGGRDAHDQKADANGIHRLFKQVDTLASSHETAGTYFLFTEKKDLPCPCSIEAAVIASGH